MKVAELQRFLGNFVPFARAAGAAEKVAAEFERALQCLEPFKERSLTEFNDFLRRADEYDRTGKLTPPAPEKKARTPKAPKMSVDQAVQVFTDLHGRVTDPALTYADIDAAIQSFDKLTIAQLQEVSAKVGVTVPSKKKAPILEQLGQRIKELKANHERTQFRFGATG